MLFIGMIYVTVFLFGIWLLQEMYPENMRDVNVSIAFGTAMILLGIIGLCNCISIPVFRLREHTAYQPDTPRPFMYRYPYVQDPTKIQSG